MISSVHSSDTPKYIAQPGFNPQSAEQEKNAAGKPADALNPDNQDAKGSQNTAQADDKDSQLASRNSTRTAASNAAPSESEQAMLHELKQRDREVRQHEAAHVAASGGLAQGSPTYTYQRGPDGQSYAIGGEVKLDVAPDARPEDTLDKAQTIRRAAMAPAQPSAQDRAIAAKASQMEGKAQIELIEQEALLRRAEMHRDDDSPAGRLARRFFAAITPNTDPLIEATA